jgi:hypothetical protein
VKKDAANALAGGLGDAMGLEEDNQDVDELTAMEMDMLEGNVAGETAQDTKIMIRVFIDMDEDDKNEKEIKFNDMFNRTDLKMPFFVDVSQTLKSFIAFYRFKFRTTSTARS